MEKSWLSRRAEGLLDNLIGQAVIAVLASGGFALWAIIRKAPDYLVALVVILGVIGIFGLLRLSIWVRNKVRKPAVLDYWRCPDGKLHEWIYWRGENTGVYMYKNCRSQVDKVTLKAHTDQGPLSDTLADPRQEDSPSAQQITSTAGRDSYAAGRDVNINPPPIAPPQAYQPREILARAIDEAETNSSRTGISRIYVETEFLDMAWRHPNYSRWPQSLRDSMKAYRRQIGIARQWGHEYPSSYIRDYFDKNVIPTIEDFIREARAELSKLPHMD